MLIRDNINPGLRFLRKKRWLGVPRFEEIWCA